MTSDLFRPRLPLDPFAAIDHDIPWSIPQTIPLSHPQTILILGEPAIHDLLPLLTSTYISRSLVLIATDTPPLIPANAQGPALRILRLAQPLAAHDTGAVRLVSLFERAQRAAHLWPRDSFPHTIQLAQPSPNGDFSIVESVSYAHPTEKSPTSRYPSPAPSTSESVSSSKWRSGLSPHKKLRRTPSPLKFPDDKALFDAIINFIPHGLPDKALLKNAILVTTLSAQFFRAAPPISTRVDWKTCSSHSQTNPLSISSPSHSHSSTSFPSSGSTPDTSPCPSPPPRRSPTARAKNRLSLFFHAAPPSPPPSEVSENQSVEGSQKVKNAHLVHVLPLGWSPDSDAEFNRGDRRASSSLSPSKSGGPSHSAIKTKTPGSTDKPKLVQSIEQFLLSFAYPLGSLVSGHFISSGSACSGIGVSSLSSNLNQKPKLGLTLSSTYEKEHALLRASTLYTPPTTSNLTNVDTPLKPAPYLLASGVFGSRVLGSDRSDVRSRCSPLDEDDLEQSRDLDTRGGAYMDAYTDPEATTLTIGEIILLGALDFDHTRSGTGPGDGRVWIGDVGDVVVTGGSPSPDLSSRKVGVGKGKGREVAIVNTEMMKRNVNGLPTPPESLSSNDSAESVEEEQKEELLEYARPIPPAKLSTNSSQTHRDSTPNTRSNVSIRKSLISTPTILNSKQGENTSHKIKDKNFNRFSHSLSSPSRTSPLPLPSPVQPPPLVIHRDRARSPRGSEDSYDLGLGHGVPVPPMIVSMKPGSRSASGSGLGSAMVPLQTQGDDAPKGAYGETQSLKKGSERKDLVGTLRKMGWWKIGSVGVGLKA